MRILLIAYEFPPSRSPQSLRWAYLARELQRLGHDVHVLTIDLGGGVAEVMDLPGVSIHRTWAGPFRGAVAFHRKRKAVNFAPPIPPNDHMESAAAQPAISMSRGGWKMRLSQQLQKMAELIVFPDLRGEWKRLGRRRLLDLLSRLEPDVVVSSHEPATTLELGLEASKRGYPWIADLGDPVLAPYTHPRWKRRAHTLEAETWRNADHVLVTSSATLSLLSARHGSREDLTVITQGHDCPSDVPTRRTSRADGNPVRLELLYTGSFYSFRDPTALLRAVVETAGVRLSIASVSLPDSVRELAQKHPQSLRLLGFLPHAEAVQWQRGSDILVNIANADPQQIPGKFFEYLGSGRPILHLRADVPDEAAVLIEEHGLGWVVDQNDFTLKRTVRELLLKFRLGELERGLRHQSFDRDRYSWSTLGKRVSDVVARVHAKRYQSNGSLR